MSATGQQSPDVIVVGAGLAGLAAAVALSSAGAKVTLLERKPYVGGRAYSYQHPALGEEIDGRETHHKRFFGEGECLVWWAV